MHIFLGRTIGRHVELAHDESMIDLVLRLSERGIDFTRGTVKGDALVSRSRSILASVFLRSEADVLVSIDGDIIFRPDDVISLAQKCVEGHDLIGGLYMTRAMRTQPAALLPEFRVEFHSGSEPVETQFISTGFMAVHKRVVERLALDLPLCHHDWAGEGGANMAFHPFYMPFIIPWEGSEQNLYLSEDWAFCQRARDAGFKIWLDPSIRLGHIGEYTFRLEDLLRVDAPPQAMALERERSGELNIFGEEPDAPPPPAPPLWTPEQGAPPLNRAARRALARAGR